MNQSTKTYQCIIADDNKLDRLTLQSYVRRYPFLNIAGVFGSAAEALAFVQEHTIPSVLFLDIDMPAMSGLELRQQLLQIPACIFVTSHPEFALEGFELAALDYIVKPLQAERFAQTMGRLEQYLELHTKAALLDYTLGADTLYIKDGLKHIKIQLHDILYLEALKDYTGIITRERKFCVSTPLGSLLKEDGFHNFTRIHCSYAVPLHFIKELSSKGVKVHEQYLPVGRSYKESLEKLLLK